MSMARSWRSCLKQLRSCRISLTARLLLGPISGLLTGLLAYSFSPEIDSKMAKTLGVTVFMIVWWIDGSVNMGVTSLLPIALLPVLGILPGNQVCKCYFADTVVVCFSSLLMAYAVEYYNLHSMLAHELLRVTRGWGEAGVLLSFVLATGFLSMWLSNTATAALMLPLANAAYVSMRSNNLELSQDPVHNPLYPNVTNATTSTPARSNTPSSRFGEALDLSVAFASSLGGMATLTGTGSNLVLQATLAGAEGDAEEGVSFVIWFLLAAPISLLCLLALWGILWMHVSWGKRLAISVPKEEEIEEHKGIEMLSSQPAPHAASASPSLSSSPVAVSMGYAPRVVLGAFVLLALLWMTRDPPGGWGWVTLLLPASSQDYVTDGTVGMGMALILLILPDTPPSCWNSSQTADSYVSVSSRSVHGEESEEKEEAQVQVAPKSDDPLAYSTLLPWSCIRHIRWGVVFLLGGGVALSQAFEASGVSAEIGEVISSLSPPSYPLFLAGVVLMTCALTNCLSNLAAANLLLPLLRCSAPLSYDLPPLALLMPVTLTLSLAFLLPLGTPPNAMVMGNGRVSVGVMGWVGGLLTIACLVILLSYSLLLLPSLLGREGLKEAKEDCADVD